MTTFNKISILSENYAHKVSCAEWGFSALIEVNKKKYLFDVGYSGNCVLENAKELGVELKGVDSIILSHGHYDHTGGLEKVLKYTGVTQVYAHPNIFADRYSLKNGELVYSGMRSSKKELEELFGTSFILNKEITKIDENIYMTGEVPLSNDVEKISSHFKVKVEGEIEKDFFPDDNSLILDTPKGVVIIFGCAHRGIVNIISHIKKTMGKKIYGIIGGTHLYNANEKHFKYVVDFIQSEDIQLIAPGHCTGIDKIYDLKEIFGNRVVPAFCGEIIEF